MFISPYGSISETGPFWGLCLPGEPRAANPSSAAMSGPWQGGRQKGICMPGVILGSKTDFPLENRSPDLKDQIVY